MISERIKNLEESKTTAAAQKARELKAQGKDIISLTVGESDFQTPKLVLDAAAEAMYAGKGHHYTANNGLPELRQAIADYHERHDGVKYDIDEIIVTNGAKSVLFYLFQTLLNEGDEVLFPVPYWVSYSEQIKLAGGVPVEILTTQDNNYALTIDMIEAQVTDKTKVLILNYPNNPSGAILSAEQLRAIGEYCVAHNILIIADEIYNRLIYDNVKVVSMPSLSEAIYKQTILVNGLAKSHAMTGWRIGYACGSKELIKALTKLAGQASGNPAGVSQYAAIAAFNDADSEVEKMRQSFEQRSAQAYNLIKDIPGFKLTAKPQGAFYLFPDCAEAAEKTGYSSVDDFVLALLEEANVAAVVGSAFGMPNHIRFSYATSEENFAVAMDRIHKFIAAKTK